MQWTHCQTSSVHFCSVHVCVCVCLDRRWTCCSTKPNLVLHTWVALFSLLQMLRVSTHVYGSQWQQKLVVFCLVIATCVLQDLHRNVGFCLRLVLHLVGKISPNKRLWATNSSPVHHTSPPRSSSPSAACVSVEIKRETADIGRWKNEIRFTQSTAVRLKKKKKNRHLHNTIIKSMISCSFRVSVMNSRLCSRSSCLVFRTKWDAIRRLGQECLILWNWSELAGAFLQPWKDSGLRGKEKKKIKSKCKQKSHTQLCSSSCHLPCRTYCRRRSIPNFQTTKEIMFFIWLFEPRRNVVWTVFHCSLCSSCVWDLWYTIM